MICPLSLITFWRQFTFENPVSRYYLCWNHFFPYSSFQIISLSPLSVTGHSLSLGIIPGAMLNNRLSLRSCSLDERDSSHRRWLVSLRIVTSPIRAILSCFSWPSQRDKERERSLGLFKKRCWGGQHVDLMMTDGGCVSEVEMSHLLQVALQVSQQHFQVVKSIRQITGHFTLEKQNILLIQNNFNTSSMKGKKICAEDELKCTTP